MAALASCLSRSFCIIWCHGSGDDGPGAASYVQAVTMPATLASLNSQGVQFAYPTAVPRSYTLAGGARSSIWFDRLGGMAPTFPEATESVLSSVAQIEGVIEELVERRNIPASNIVLGGFSMGGGISLQVAARTRHKLAGVFALSSYLCDDSQAYSEIAQRRQAEGRGAVPARYRYS